MTERRPQIREVLPPSGIFFQQEFQSFVLCKPKLIPLKSVTLEKLENMQKEVEEKAKEQLETNLASQLKQER